MKFWTLALVLAVFVGYEFSIMYVPDGLERPFFFKTKFLALKISGILAKIGDALNIGTQASNLRLFVDLMSKTIPLLKNNIKINNTLIENVAVRIYERPNSNIRNRPVMVYFHGGGYAIGGLDLYDLFLIQIVKLIDILVISVDYRMAPEHPFPTPTNDCFTVAKYVVENYKKFNINPDKLIIAGDSAGGNAVAVTAQRMLNENVKLPKIQILIYPWLQMFTFHLPSLVHYSDTGLVRATQVDLVDYVSWYLGVKNVSEEIRKNLLVNNHTLLISDPEKRRLFGSYLNASLIPEEYRSGKKYYDQEAELFPSYELDKNSVLRDPKYFEYFKKASDPQVTPLFAEHKSLIGLPKTYFVITEWDSLKDEAILYSLRLKDAGVDVNVKFYEDGFHGIALLVGELTGYQLADKIIRDMIGYIEQNL